MDHTDLLPCGVNNILLTAASPWCVIVYYPGTVIVPGENKCILACNADLSDVSNLAFLLKSIDVFAIKTVTAFIDKNGPKVGVVSSHLNIVVVVISHQ